MARSKGPVSDILSILIQLPWWVGVAVAAVIGIGGQAYASRMEPTVATNIVRMFIDKGSKVLAGLCLLAAAISAIKRLSRRKLLDRQSGLDSLKSLSWREFEHLVGEAYRRQGYAVEETGGGGADGGIDLILRGRGQTILVQCKQWRQQQVGVDKVRELYGVVCAEHAEHGILVTTGRYTRDAYSFKAGKPLTLVDGPALATLVASVRSAPAVPFASQGIQAAGLPSPAPAGRPPQTQPVPSDSACPKCGAPMKLRTAKRGVNAGSSFYGCTRYPDCRGIRQA